MDINRAFEVLNGVDISPEEGVDGPFITGGPMSPIGLDIPIRSIYYQNDSAKVKIWLKFGIGVNDWRELSAQDIPFDPTGYLNFDPTDTDVEKALAKIGNFSIGEIAQIEGFVSNNEETTTSNGWVSKSGFPWTTVGVKTAGTFSLRWFAEVGQTKATRNFGFRVRWRPAGGSWSILSELPLLTVSRDNNKFQQSGFKQITLPVDNNIQIDFQHGQTTDGFASILSNVSVEVRRIGDL